MYNTNYTPDALDFEILQNYTLLWEMYQIIEKTCN